jgi:HlyD family secretion protein
MAKTDIFRKVAMDRLASPEQLDQLMQVTTPKGWLALTAVTVVLVLAIIWSVAGTLPERVGGQAILLRSAGIFEVVSQSSGRITDMSAQVGDKITEGQVVARLAQPDLSDQVKDARARVTELAVQARQMVAMIARDSELQSRSLEQRRSNLNEAIKAADADLARLNDKIETQSKLVSQGLLTRQTLLAAQQEAEQTTERIRAYRADLAQLSVTGLQTKAQEEQQLQSSRTLLADARRTLDRLASQLDLESRITTPYSGRVLEILGEQGSVVDRGKAILTLSLDGNAVTNLVAIVYVPSVHGKKIRPGMEIGISPSTVNKEEYGYLVGRVTYVSDFPATPAGMLRVLKNPTLVQTLSGQDTPYEVHAELIPEPSSPSQLRWSSSHGPPTHIQSGTLATADIIVNRIRPIFMVLPQLNRTFTGTTDSIVSLNQVRP